MGFTVRFLLLMLHISTLSSKLLRRTSSSSGIGRLLRTSSRNAAIQLQRKLLQPSLLSSPSPATVETEDNEETSTNHSTFYSELGVSIRNTQRKYRVDLIELCDQIITIRELLGIEDFHVDVLVCSDIKMRALNAAWRGYPKSTGIINPSSTETGLFNNLNI